MRPIQARAPSMRVGAGWVAAPIRAGDSTVSPIGARALVRILFAVALLASICALDSCGLATSATPGSVGAAATAPAVAPIGTAIGSDADNGCPAQQAPTDAASFKPDVTVSQKPTDAGAVQPIALTRGQRLELRLQPSVQWQLMLADPDHILARADVEGWYDRALNACVWRYTATATGSAQLNFSGAVQCPFRELCPSSDQALTYKVTVR